MSKASKPWARLSTLAGLALCLPANAPAATSAGTNVTTYHYDNLRTGWNQTETVLTPANVASGNFGLLTQVALDEQVDGQPLFVSGLSIAGGTHDTVFVATENNSIYAIDANTGAVLLQQNFGTPVPITALPGECNNNSNNIGINSTPVIDLSTNTLYAITYTYDNGTTQTFRLHALDLSTLTDKTPPVVISAGNTYRNGQAAGFSAANQRQRPALLESGGKIYAGFGSFCDINANLSRGWVLGWQAGSLTPLPANKLVNQLARSGDDFFLSSVWMSGYGIATDDQNGIFFITGNSDYNGRTYNSTYNIAESVVNMSADLTTVQGFFTPTGPNGWSAFDKVDNDFGSAGVLLLPTQPGAYPHLAVAAGKGGPMVLLNRDNLGGVGLPRKVTLGTYPNYGCWCGQSYYMGADGIGRVVESTGGNTMVWKVQTSPTTKLVFESSSPGINTGDDPGFFTSISSNGTQPGTAVIWALARTSGGDPTTTAYLWAFDPANASAALLSAPLAAGTWPFAGNANANLVPVVANGHVFVASYGNLSIFGLSPARTKHPSLRMAARPAPVVFREAPHEVYGIVTAVKGTVMTLQNRFGKTLQVDMASAAAASHMAPPAAGNAALVRGSYGADGRFVAKYVLHAKKAPLIWPADH